MTARVYLKIRTFYAATNNPAAHEAVYLDQLSSNKVFFGRTDELGNVRFLLPKGEKYMLHFDYQPDVDVIEFTNIKGIGEARSDIYYKPDPKLQYPERYIPDPESLFLEEFQKKNFRSMKSAHSILLPLTLFQNPEPI